MDCGFFIPISHFRGKMVGSAPDKPAHKAEVFEPEKLKMPKEVASDYNVIEIPRSLFNTSGKPLLRPSNELGENDKAKLIAFKEILDGGFKIKSVSPSGSNYLFLLEKV